jgi:prepilin-type N-terminal cleavage/methylation domain-containing protein/prepilin-type processing-associated H-X9-DG protein
MINSTRKAQSGFTLIELLVVIAIIAILSSILFPVFARARENARRSSCSSNLKQIGLGMMQYTQDYDEKFPLIWNQWGVPTGTPYGWADALQPYLKSTQILKCPSASGVTSGDPTQGGYSYYAYNLLLAMDSQGNFQEGKSLAVLTQPTLTVMNIDYVGGAGYVFDGGCGIQNACAIPAGLALNPVAKRHLDGVNIAFCDGHVKWSKAASDTTLANVYNAVTPGTDSKNNPTFNVSP